MITKNDEALIKTIPLKDWNNLVNKDEICQNGKYYDILNAVLIGKNVQLKVVADSFEENFKTLIHLITKNKLKHTNSKKSLKKNSYKLYTYQFTDTIIGYVFPIKAFHIQLVGNGGVIKTFY